ncbi:MAG: VCBS repeat-containing protein [Armatimonadetes bacterium]|nr:VCBS repeat-containing protein [Armatimonadota bacterium]
MRSYRAWQFMAVLAAWIGMLTGALGNSPAHAQSLFETPKTFSFQYKIYGFEARGDFNRDGHIDKAIVGTYRDVPSLSPSKDAIAVFLNKGDGTFHEPVYYQADGRYYSQYPLIADDFTGDNILDFILPGGGGPNSVWIALYVGKGDGTFHPSKQVLNFGRSGLYDIAVSDVNRDGLNEIIYTLSGGFYSVMWIAINKGGGTFVKTQTPPLPQSPYPFEPQYFMLRDINQDGIPDIYLTAETYRTIPPTFFIHIGKGDGTFLPAIQLTSLTQVAADFNGDGIADLAFTQRDDTVRVALGTGGSAYGPETSYPLPGVYALTKGDFDRDGHADVAAIDASNRITLLMGQGSGRLAPRSGGQIEDAAPHDLLTATDLNGDDWTDLVASAGGKGFHVLLNTPVNRPVAFDRSFSTSEDTPATVTLQGSSPNPGAALTYSVMTGPAHGTLSGTVPDLTYTPDTNYHGLDSFTYKVHEGQFGSNTATVSLTITSVNDPPQAREFVFTLFWDNSLTLTLTGSDVDGDPLAYSVVAPPRHGSLSGAPPHLTYTPAPGYSGSDSFSYKASDGKLESNIATVSLNVIVPRLTIGSGSVGPGETAEVTISLTGASTEVAGLNLYLRAVGPKGSLPLKPGFRLASATQGWNVVLDPNNPWHVTLASASPLAGPADVLYLRLTSHPSTPSGTVYRIEAALAEVSDARGQVIEIRSLVAPGGLSVAPCEARTKGDVNADGVVNIRDAISVLRVAAEIETPPNSCVRSAADVNCSGAVNVGDAVLVLRHITFGEAFPACP